MNDTPKAHILIDITYQYINSSEPQVGPMHNGSSGPKLKSPSTLVSSIFIHICIFVHTRPWSVDSLNGGATDVMEKPPK